MNKELIIALAVLFIALVADNIAGIGLAKRNRKFDKEKLIAGLYKAATIIIVTILLGLAFQLDSTLVVNDTPLLEYLVAIYQMTSLVIVGQAVIKVTELIGIYVPKEEDNI